VAFDGRLTGHPLLPLFTSGDRRDQLPIFFSEQLFNGRREFLLQLIVELAAGGRGETGMNVLHAAVPSNE
jgi:hypothetical protein